MPIRPLKLKIILPQLICIDRVMIEEEEKKCLKVVLWSLLDPKCPQSSTFYVFYFKIVPSLLI